MFCYVGSLVDIDKSMGIHEDVRKRVAAALAAFGLLQHVWRSKRISLTTKARMLMVCVSTVLAWGAESWVLRDEEIRLLHKT